MIRALHTAATGIDAQQVKIDNITNNLANVNTPGFKRGRAEFQDLFYESLAGAGAVDATGAVSPNGLDIGHGVRTVAIRRVFLQGDLLTTSNPLDVAIDGEGFLAVARPEGDVAYTRAGSLSLSNAGELVTPQGLPLDPSITVPPDTLELRIAQDGTVSALQAGQTAATELGQLNLVRFANPGGLHPIGSNLFLETDASGAPTAGAPGTEGLGRIVQGFLEGSNVSVAEELVNMIVVQRAYEINARAVRVADEMLQAAATVR